MTFAAETMLETTSPVDGASALEARLQEDRQAVLDHPIYRRLKSVEDLRVFMEHHVFAVWDFMFLLKALQRRLTCVEEIWVPTEEPRLRRLVNEIVLEEESDRTESGEVASHFEMYLSAMEDAGADTEPARRFVEALRRGDSVEQSLESSRAPLASKEFVLGTDAVVRSADPVRLAAAFTYGREDLIPALFTQIVDELGTSFPEKLAKYRYYLDRHIELDGDHHGPLAREMVSHLCGHQPDRWSLAAEVSLQCLRSRRKLWDGVLEVL